MKNKFILTAIFSMLLAAVAISAQTAKPNYAGEWTLDVGKSNLPDRMRVESMTMKVTQTEKELKIESATKRSQNDVRGGGGMRGGGGGVQIATYNLDGKETTSEIGGGAKNGKETRKATATTDGKLSLTVTRSFNDGTGDVTLKTNETWELANAGKTLKVTRYMETPRGATNAELYFTKKSSLNSSVTKANSADANQTEKTVSDNKARVFGSVKVKVTIDEKGKVISAKTVEGQRILRPKAEEMAIKAKFAPTLLAGVPVKITGIIVYNFVP